MSNTQAIRLAAKFGLRKPKHPAPIVPKYVGRIAYYWAFEDYGTRPRELIEDIAKLCLGTDGAVTRIQARDLAEPFVVYNAPAQPMARLIAVVLQDMIHVPNTGWQ